MTRDEAIEHGFRECQFADGEALALAIVTELKEHHLPETSRFGHGVPDGSEYIGTQVFDAPGCSCSPREYVKVPCPVTVRLCAAMAVALAGCGVPGIS